MMTKEEKKAFEELVEKEKGVFRKVFLETPKERDEFCKCCSIELGEKIFLAGCIFGKKEVLDIIISKKKYGMKLYSCWDIKHLSHKCPKCGKIWRRIPIDKQNKYKTTENITETMLCDQCWDKETKKHKSKKVKEPEDK